MNTRNNVPWYRRLWLKLRYDAQTSDEQIMLPPNVDFRAPEPTIEERLNATLEKHRGHHEK